MKGQVCEFHRNSRHPYGLTLRVVEQRIGSQNGSNGDETIAGIGTEIRFSPNILDTYHYDGWKPVHYDLLVVCAAVEFADCQCRRSATRWSRPFQITLPVLELAAWQQPEVQTHLQNTLRHLTGDEWRFFFVQAVDSAVNGTRQGTLPFPNNKEFAIAYSDGLDSRCVSSLFDAGDSAVRIRVTDNKDSIRDGEQPFDRIPFTVTAASSRESSMRSRGFKFAAIAAIAGHLSNVGKIIVPESGQDALVLFCCRYTISMRTTAIIPLSSERWSVSSRCCSDIRSPIISPGFGTPKARRLGPFSLSREQGENLY